jgi:hypothetical protein
MSQPAHVECCPDAIGKGCWVSDLCGNVGYRFYTGVVVGIFKNLLMMANTTKSVPEMVLKIFIRRLS